MFHTIDYENWYHKEHYEILGLGAGMSYSITVNIDVTNLYDIHKKENLKFYPMMIYVLAKAVNQTKEFKMGKDQDGNLGYYDTLHMNYTIFHEEDGSYSDLWSYYSEDFMESYNTIIKDIEDYKDARGFAPKPNRPENIFCQSSLPWLNYVNYVPVFSKELPINNYFPSFEYGKYVIQDGRKMMPLTATVFHGVADGYHTYLFYKRVQEIIDTFKIE